MLRKDLPDLPVFGQDSGEIIVIWSKLNEVFVFGVFSFLMSRSQCAADLLFFGFESKLPNKQTNYLSQHKYEGFVYEAMMNG